MITSPLLTPVTSLLTLVSPSLTPVTSSLLVLSLSLETLPLPVAEAVRAKAVPDMLLLLQAEAVLARAEL